jgi:hypothetical protein
MVNVKFELNVKGHCKIVDDLGHVILDQHNAIHPQNLSRVIARALSNEHNYFIHRVAYGNGGTTIDAAHNITYRPPNIGQSPDISTWDSRIYNEIFSKVVDDGQSVLNPLIGLDLGSADLNTGDRTGGSAVHSEDPITIPHVSGPGVRSLELGLTSEVIISAIINASEPILGGVTTDFSFDEIGLYTTGAAAINTNGYQYIDVGNKTSADATGLGLNETYSLIISVNNGTPTIITFKTPLGGGSGLLGEILYGDLCQAFNTGDTDWGFTGVNPLPNNSIISITDASNGLFSTIAGAVTNGFLKITSGTPGAASSIKLDDADWSTHQTLTSFLPGLNPPLGGILIPPASGTASGLQNTPTTPAAERERLLTHLIFTPITKPAGSSWSMTYTLTISFTGTIG